jgi:hypothetical protein
MSIRDRIAAARFDLANSRPARHIRNRAYAIRHVKHGPAMARYWNARNTRAIARGRGPVRSRAAAQVTSRTPVVRDRINPATGSPRRDDARMNRLGDQSLARFKANREARSTRGGRS